MVDLRCDRVNATWGNKGQLAPSFLQPWEDSKSPKGLYFGNLFQADKIQFWEDSEDLYPQTRSCGRNRWNCPTGKLHPILLVDQVYIPSNMTCHWLQQLQAESPALWQTVLSNVSFRTA